MRILLLLIIFFVLQMDVSAQRLKQIKSLQGYWSFSVGDNLNWRIPSHNFSAWDKISSGASWESQGYEGYNGYAWYKKRIDITNVSVQDKIYLKIDRIDDADEVYFNGALIGHMGAFPPQPQTAYFQERLYEIPTNLINNNGVNTIAVRVYDIYDMGGILGEAGLYKDVSASYLLYDLSGYWKFKVGKSEKYKQFDYDDTNWDELYVPEKWESQGYPNLNGYAWYRKSFDWNNISYNDELIVVLGRIDDKDIVYLNGEKIGAIDDLKRGKYFAGKEDYQTLRAYRISRSSLNRGKNVLAIQVWDDRYDGGIYDGPMGIMTVEAFEKYFAEYEQSKNMIEHFFDSFFD